jgi:hypothetical protein
MLGDKLPVGSFAVGRNADNFDIAFLEFTIQVTESLGFFRSAGCVVFGIKIEDKVFSFEIT